jgi:tetratricopeptide (TPR) repeat protein
MKKLFMFALMAAAATTAFAQDDLVKQAKKQFGNGNLDAAAATLKPALTNAATKDKAAAWNLMNDICYKQFTNEFDKAKMAQPFDTTKMYNGLLDGYAAALECDKYDIQPNEKGKVKIRFRKANADRYFPERQQFYNAGVIRYTKNNHKGAMEAWGVYVNSATASIFEEVKKPEKDEYLGEALYNTALLSYQQKDYANAVKYAEMAAQIPDKKEAANDIVLFSKKESLKNAADSLEYVKYIKDLHKANPESQKYFNLLNEYYNAYGKENERVAWLQEELAANPNDKMLWAMKGEVEMNNGKLDDAIASFKKSVEADPEFLPAIYNTGVCLNNKAMDLQTQLADKNGMISKQNQAKVLDVLKDAMKYFERAREIDPEHQQVNWPYLLYRTYNAVLGESDPKTQEVGKIAGVL